MTITQDQRFNVLANRIEKEFPGSTVSATFFPSQAVSLEIRFKNRFFIIDYSSSLGYGVDELKGSMDEAFDSGYTYCFTDFDETVNSLYKLLNNCLYQANL
jgi:hypothetical protein